jgi:flagellar assembly protein FliH
MNSWTDGFRAGIGPDAEPDPDDSGPRRFAFPELDEDAPGSASPASESEFAPLRFQGGREAPPDRVPTEVVAERILAEARNEAEALRARTREEGYAAGLAEGREAARAETAALLARLGEALAELDARRADLHRQAERGAVRLALAAAERIVAREVSADPDIVLGVVRETLGAVDHPERLVVRVHPDAVARLDAEALAALAGTETVSVVPDAAISPGGCRVETGLGELDARMETRLDEVSRALEIRL